jgi:hypothetical protein
MKRLRKYYPLLIAVALSHVLVGIVLAAPAATLPVSKGVYRLPYANGTVVTVTNDHETHPVQNRLDLAGIQGSGVYTIVAAGDGWIQTIVDTYTLSQCQQSNPACGNNYVWIEHPNGEWSKYSHFQPGSVSDLGWFPGDWIQSGQALGREGDIGLASGPHIHFEVAVPDDPDNPIGNARFGWLDPNGSFTPENRIPAFCDINFPVLDGDQYTAANCREACSFSVDVGRGVSDDQVAHFQADNDVNTISGIPHIVANGAGEAFRAGQRVVLNPGFHAEQGSFFSASIGACDTPGAN